MDAGELIAAKIDAKMNVGYGRFPDATSAAIIAADMKAARKAIDMSTLFLSDWRQILHFAVPAPAGMHCSLKYSMYH